MSKEDIFSKISLKDYNNELEKVLEEKDFSEVVKNLLLSMLYKIENAYEDYETVKVNTASKKYFIKKIIKIINEKCNKIELINSSFDYLNGKEKVIKTYLFVKYYIVNFKNIFHNFFILKETLVLKI